MIIDPEEASRCLWVAIDRDDVFVQVKGHATFAISPALKQFSIKLIKRPCRRLILDMSGCEGVDSTFMGVLAGLSMRLKKKAGSSMVMVNLPQDIYETFCILGLNRIISCSLTGMCPADVQDSLRRLGQLNRIEMKSADKKATTKTMIEAHTNLIQIDKENLPKFKDVLSFLREDLKKKKGNAS